MHVPFGCFNPLAPDGPADNGDQVHGPKNGAASG
jgi:hypothetical protein